MDFSDLIYCHNCTRYGHDSSTCQNNQWPQQFKTPAFVPNYVEGLQNGVRRNTASRRKKALSDLKTKKESKTRNVIIPEELDDIPNDSVLYRFGSFQTSTHNGQILYKELHHNLNFKTDNFLQDQFPPLFMHELVKIVPFDLIIYRSEKKLFMRTRGITGTVGYVQEIINYWLKLSLEDKRSLKVYLNIPRDVEELLNVFYTKWKDIVLSTDNPNTLANEINSLKSTLTEISDPSIVQTTTDKILSLKSKLLNLYNAKVTQLPEALRQITTRVKKSLCTKPCNFIFTDKVYLRCILIYNEIYLPRTLTNNEMQVLIAKYNEIPKKRSKKWMKTHDPYNIYLHSYNQNMMPIIQKRETEQKEVEKRNPENSSITSLNIIQEQSEKIPISAPIASITQEQNERLPACTTTGNAIQEQSNVPVLSTVSHQPDNNQMKHTSHTLIQSNANYSGENRETIKNNNALATFSSQQEHTTISETSVTKKRNRKRKRTSGGNEGNCKQFKYFDASYYTWRKP